jgi:hypothetical protein
MAKDSILDVFNIRCDLIHRRREWWLAERSPMWTIVLLHMFRSTC